MSAAKPRLLKRHVTAAVIGNALEFYDFITYAFFAVQIGRTFFPSDDAYASLMASLGTFGAGFAMRPVGGIVLGHYADRAGRRPAMLLSFGMMGLSVLALAIIPSYATIGLAAPVLVVLARLVQGFALGGEVGSTTAFLVEAAPAHRRGLYASWQGASQYVANLVGGVVGFALSSMLSADALDQYGWRIAFLLGAVIIPFGLVLRNSLPETLHHDDDIHGETAREPAAAVWRRNARIIVIGLVVLASLTIFTYVNNYMTTFAQATLHMSAGVAYAATVVVGSMGIIGTLLGGHLSDIWGRWPLMVWPRVVNVLITYPVYLWIVDAKSTFALLLGTALLTFTGVLGAGAFYPAFSESLPKSIRGSAFGTSYATSIAIFGGTTQLAITWLIHVTGSPLAPGIYAIVAGVFGIIAIAMMAETAPMVLRKKR